MKIGIIVGSIRSGSTSRKVAQWVLEQAPGTPAAQGDDVHFELVDLAEFDVPLLTSPTVPGAANKQYDDERVTRWSQAIDSYDGFIFVTPEYNHGVPGGFKNAFDSLGSEWARKTVAFVSHGADGGIRAVEQWRQIVVNFQMVDVRAQIALGMFTDFADGAVAPMDRRSGELAMMTEQLVAATRRAQN